MANLTDSKESAVRFDTTQLFVHSEKVFGVIRCDTFSIVRFSEDRIVYGPVSGGSPLKPTTSTEIGENSILSYEVGGFSITLSSHQMPRLLGSSFTTTLCSTASLSHVMGGRIRMTSP